MKYCKFLIAELAHYVYCLFWSGKFESIKAILHAICIYFVVPCTQGIHKNYTFYIRIICLATVFSELLPEYQNVVNVVVALISFYSCVIPIYRNDWKKYKESMSGIKPSVENNINNGKDVY